MIQNRTQHVSIEGLNLTFVEKYAQNCGPLFQSLILQAMAIRRFVELLNQQCIVLTVW